MQSAKLNDSSDLTIEYLVAHCYGLIVGQRSRQVFLDYLLSTEMGHLHKLKSTTENVRFWQRYFFLKHEDILTNELLVQGWDSLAVNQWNKSSNKYGSEFRKSKSKNAKVLSLKQRYFKTTLIPKLGYHTFRANGYVYDNYLVGSASGEGVLFNLILFLLHLFLVLVTILFA